jgi:predicted Zn-dependent protease
MNDISLPDSAYRRVLSFDEALSLGEKMLELRRFNPTASMNSVRIEHVVRTVTKVTSNAVLHADDGDSVRISFQSRFGSGLPVSIRTNQLTDTMLQRIVSRTQGMMALVSEKDSESDDPDDMQYFTYNKRPHLPVSLWHDTTIRAAETVRGEVVSPLVEMLQTSGLVGSTTIGFTARSVLYLYQQGLTAFARETDSEMSVTARTSNDEASGWSGEANRDWTKIHPSAVARKAIDLAKQSQGMVAFEPGRRTVILSPTAVAELVAHIAYLFDSELTKAGGGPFSFASHDPRGRHTKLGMRVFDPRIVMKSDPADPLGGFPPFFEPGGIEHSVPGYPVSAVTFINEGRLEHLAYSISHALERRLSPCDWPRSVCLTTVPGTRTATIEEMISNCSEGIYVNRFSNVELLDRTTGMMTGVTRDGCFLVKRGKITKPVKNFRFIDSPFFAFNKLQMIGKSERVAFGYNTAGEASRWPRLPVIVPPMMIEDFNFSAMTDSV